MLHLLLGVETAIYRSLWWDTSEASSATIEIERVLYKLGGVDRG
jgi:hypothetical protein